MGKFNSLEKKKSLIKPYRHENIDFYFRLRSPLGYTIDLNTSSALPGIQNNFSKITDYIYEFKDEITINSVSFHSKEGTEIHRGTESKICKIAIVGSQVLLDIFNNIGFLLGGTDISSVNMNLLELDLLKIDRKNYRREGSETLAPIENKTLYKNISIDSFSSSVSSEGYGAAQFTMNVENYLPNWSGTIWKLADNYETLLDGKFI